MRPLFSLLMLPVLALGCSSVDDAGDEGQFSSNEATLMTFEFDATVKVDPYVFSNSDAVEAHLLYTIGQLNGNKSVGRLDAVKLTNVRSEQKPDAKIISYHASLPVAWGSKKNLPTQYNFILPKDVTSAGTEAFTEKYMHSCVEAGAHDVDSGSIWYYYRPSISSCKLDEADVQRITAKVTKSTEITTGKYPEYNKVWEDKTLNVVAVFGKYENGKTTASDAGISGYNNFVSQVSSILKPYSLTTTPASVPFSPGVKMPDIEMRGTLADGSKIKVNALLVDEVSTASPEFFARYESLSTDADMIAYNGHAGLGQNVRALSAHGKFKKGQYLIVFMNGCDTFAYVDGSLAQTRAALNPDDPTGTKYMEFVTNAMPSFFSNMPNASLALINGLMSKSKPKTYNEIFKDISSSQVVVVTGEEDNTFKP